MNDDRIERQVQRGGRNMERDNQRDVQSRRADDAFEREDRPRRDIQEASEAAYESHVLGWPEIEDSLRDNGVAARKAQAEAAAAHAQRMTRSYTDKATFLLDLAQERAWARHTGDSTDLELWVSRNAASVVGKTGL